MNANSGEMRHSKAVHENLNWALDESRRVMRSYRFSDDFQQLSTGAGISSDNLNTCLPEYWGMFADSMGDEARKTRAMFERRGDIEGANFATLCELSSCVQSHILAMHRLHRSGESTSIHEQHRIKLIASHFNHLIRQVGLSYQGLTAESLILHLLNTFNESIGNINLQAFAAKEIRDAVKGAQYEAAVGQMLYASGRRFVHTTYREDVILGADFYVMGRDGNYLRLDVKSALHRVPNTCGPDSPYSIDGGRIVMHALVGDEQLNGGFILQPDTAAAYAQWLDLLIDEADPGLPPRVSTVA